MKQIRIGDASIPLDSYAVGGTAFLGIRESGKSYGAKGVAEQLIDYGIPIVVFDAIGVWQYLKRSRGAGGKGYPVVVAGGRHPDLPLTPDSAPQIVRSAIASNVSVVIDLYDRNLSKADWRRIVRACFRTLFFENEGLRHVFLEETPEYAPQKVIDGETYAEVEKFVRMGGNSSLGITLIGQRAQEINKAILDLCENVVLMRQRGAHAIDSLEKFMDRVSPDMAKEVARSLPNLKAGECWVFTGDSETPIRTRTAKINSHHPDRRKPELTARAGAPADVSSFVESMREALPRLAAEADARDPAKLQARIRELELQLARGAEGAGPEVVAAAVDTATRDGYEAGKSGMLSAVRDRVGGRLRDALQRMQAAGALLQQATDGHAAVGEALSAAIAALDGDLPIETALAPPVRRRAAAAPFPAGPVNRSVQIPAGRYRAGPAPAAPPRAPLASGALPKGEAALLELALQYDRDGGVLKSSLAVLLVGMAERTRQTYQQRMRAKGLIDDAGDRIRATDAGRRALPNVRPLPTGEQLVAHWRAELPGGERDLFELLVGKPGTPMSVDEFMKRTSFAERTTQTYLQRLTKRGVVERSGRAMYRLASTFFE